MINYKTISDQILEGRMVVPYRSATEVFGKLKDKSKQKFILESKDVSHIYGRLSLVGIDPVMRISGKDDRFRIEVLNSRGGKFLAEISDDDLGICDEFERNEKSITGMIVNDKAMVEETKRSQKKNIAQVIRLLLEKFKVEQKVLMGLYGGFAYDFIRLFEDIPSLLPENDVNDFDLCLYDSFIYFDLLKEQTEVVVYRETTQGADEAIHAVIAEIAKGASARLGLSRGLMDDSSDCEGYKISDADFVYSKEDYEGLVEIARKYALEGEMFEVVFANSLKAKFEGDPFALYMKYREINPSPYLFFFDFGDDQLVGASPEMMVRVENGQAHLRPISGTAKRGQDPIEDHDNMLALLADPKERAELDMLIDLGRNDLSRICKPGIEISDYRFVEKYSRVMHTVAHLTGELRDGYIALDALIACLNAGTLTGAPKVAAMIAIEKHEKERRGYYGGTIGYLSFSGEMDTGIVIRTAYIKDNKLDLKAGATLLYDSQPEKEYQETVNKAQAFLDTFS